MRDHVIPMGSDDHAGAAGAAASEVTRCAPPGGDPAGDSSLGGFRPSPGPAGGPGGRPLPSIAGYEVLGELGRGGVGVVYLARNLRLNRPCALKMILAGAHADAATTLRFLGEAEAVARLQHPHVVAIYHVGEADGLPFLELEHVVGGSLAGALDGTPWPPSRAAGLVAGLARGMAEAHRLGILHRDLKPANVLLADDGLAKVSDFGLAKTLAGDAGLTRTDSILGSPSYMAPEQAEGRADRAGLAADVYSLGAILYELLAGRPAFRAATVLATLALVKVAEPVAPSRLVPGIPRDLETIVLKCLRKEPARRYASAASLAEDFRRFEAGEPILARRAGLAERGWRWCRRNPALAALNALAATLVVTVAVVSTVAAVTLRRQRDRAEAGARDLEVANGKARAAEGAARVATAVARAAGAVARAERDRAGRLLYVSNLRLAQQVWADADGGARAVADLLAQHVPPGPGPGDRREFTWRLEWTRLHRSAPTWQAERAPESAALTAAGRLVTLDGLGALREWDAATGRPGASRSLGAGGTPRGLALASTGAVAAAGDADRATLRLFDPADGRQRLALAGPPPLGAVAFAPDGQAVAVLWGDGRARAYDATTGAELGSVPLRPGPYRCLALAPGGRALFLGNHPGVGEVTAYDLRAGTATPLPGRTSTILAIAVAADGRVATGDFLGKVAFPEPGDRGSTGREVAATLGHVTQVAFAPDGRTIAAGDADGLVVARDGRGRRLATLKGHLRPIRFLAFAPDGRTLASGDIGGTIKVWDLAAPAGERPLAAADDTSDAAVAPSRIAPAPDGRALASAGARLAVRDARTGAPAWSAADRADDPQAEGETTGLAFSADARLLATGDPLGRVVVCDAATGRVLRQLDGMPAEFYGPPHPHYAMSTPRHKRMVAALAFAPGGDVLAVGYGYRIGFIPDYPQVVRAWDPRSGALLAELPVGNTVASLHFAADGRTFRATSHDGTVRSWAVADWSSGVVLQAGAAIAAAAVAPDGSVLAAGLGDGAITAWDLATGRPTFRVGGHAGVVLAVAFAPDGRTLASLGRQHGTLKLWDAATGAETLSMKPSEPAHDLAFDPAGDRLLLATRRGIRFLPALPLATIDAELAAEAARRGLDAAPPSGPASATDPAWLTRRAAREATPAARRGGG